MTAPKPMRIKVLAVRKVMPALVCAILLILLCCSIFSAGCVSASASRSVQDWNAWSGLQHNFSQQVSSTLTTMDDHQKLLNAAIASGDPDFASLRQNLATDRENLDLWIPQMKALDAAATRFYANASVLNGSAYNAGQDMNTNFNVYLMNMNAARGELVSYCKNLDTYLAEGNLDYADDSLRQGADASRERALVYLKQADDALTALDSNAATLERAQTVQGLHI